MHRRRLLREDQRFESLTVASQPLQLDWGRKDKAHELQGLLFEASSRLCDVSAAFPAGDVRVSRAHRTKSSTRLGLRLWERPSGSGPGGGVRWSQYDRGACAV